METQAKATPSGLLTQLVDPLPQYHISIEGLPLLPKIQISGVRFAYSAEVRDEAPRILMSVDVIMSVNFSPAALAQKLATPKCFNSDNVKFTILPKPGQEYTEAPMLLTNVRFKELTLGADMASNMPTKMTFNYSADLNQLWLFDSSSSEEILKL